MNDNERKFTLEELTLMKYVVTYIYQAFTKDERTEMDTSCGECPIKSICPLKPAIGRQLIDDFEALCQRSGFDPQEIPQKALNKQEKLICQATIEFMSWERIQKMQYFAMTGTLPPEVAEKLNNFSAKDRGKPKPPPETWILPGDRGFSIN
jgi:hypothetical protein